MEVMACFFFYLLIGGGGLGGDFLCHILVISNNRALGGPGVWISGGRVVKVKGREG